MNWPVYQKCSEPLVRTKRGSIKVHFSKLWIGNRQTNIQMPKVSAAKIKAKKQRKETEK